VQSGRRIVVDVDLEKFFDRVDHDILIDSLQKRIGDTGVIRLIRAYLNSGIMDDGVVLKRTMGTPQGGPLSPLLANVLLDEVDKALERRGHCSSAALHPGLEGVLPVGANTKGLARTRSVAASSVARHPAQTVEARHDHVQGTTGAGSQA
jgi:retron-type reverse transcriptase